MSRRRFGVLVLALCAIAGAIAGAAAWQQTEGARPTAVPVDTSVVVEDRNGRALRIYTATDGRWRLPVSSIGVDSRYLDMLLAYEDRRFHEHSGVDVPALLRAAWQALSSGQIVSGGSTLTMQVVRLVDNLETRSVSGKIRQIVRAWKMERESSKDAILDLYLTRAPFGGNLEGIVAAALAYFGKPPNLLTLSEAALLVALPQSPEARRPDRHPDRARAARDRVLARAVRRGIITPAEAHSAMREKVPTARRPFPILAGHAADRAKTLHPKSGAIRLTIDRPLQERLEGLARNYGQRYGKGRSLAILVADHRSGEIIASIGSTNILDAAHFGAIDMTRAVRSPGSALKPLIYGLAFEDGIAHPLSLIEDRPMSISGYSPENFDQDYRGTVSVSEALTASLNIPAVALLDAVGPARLLSRMRRAGIVVALPDDEPAGLAIGLGGLGITLRDLATLYAAIARGGAPVTLHEEPIVEPERLAQSPVLDELAAWYVRDILSKAPPPRHAMAGKIAFKTGTSYGYRDAWAVGFDGRTVIAVWVGRPDGAPVPGATGLNTAAPVVFDSFARLDGDPVPLALPPSAALTADEGALPVPLRHVRLGSGSRNRAGGAGPRFEFPLQGALIELDSAPQTSSARPLRIRIRDGKAPFSWFANGKPLPVMPFGRTARWVPDGPGFAAITVVDARGATASVRFRVR